MLVVNNVSKQFADHEVLDDVTFTLQSGEKVGLVARNGTGKSVLLRMLSEIEAFRSPMIVVSHDRTFLRGIGVTGVWLANLGSLKVIEGEDALGSVLSAMDLAAKSSVIRQV